MRGARLHSCAMKIPGGDAAIVDRQKLTAGPRRCVSGALARRARIDVTHRQYPCADSTCAEGSGESERIGAFEEWGAARALDAVGPALCEKPGLE